MSTRIYRQYVGLDVLYIHNGNCLFEANNPHHPVATVKGCHVYFGMHSYDIPAATLDRNGFIYAGPADCGQPIGYTDGERLMDMPGNPVILSAEEYDPEGLAMACILRYGDDALRSRVYDARNAGSTDTCHGEFHNTPGNSWGNKSGEEYMEESRNNSMDGGNVGGGGGENEGILSILFGDTENSVRIFQRHMNLMKSHRSKGDGMKKKRPYYPIIGEERIELFETVEWKQKVCKIQREHNLRRKENPMWRRKMRLWGLYARVPLIFAVVALGIYLIFDVMGTGGLATVIAIAFAIVSYVIGKICIGGAVDAAKESIYEYNHPGYLEKLDHRPEMMYDFDNPPYSIRISSEE